MRDTCIGITDLPHPEEAATRSSRRTLDVRPTLLSYPLWLAAQDRALVAQMLGEKCGQARAVAVAQGVENRRMLGDGVLPAFVREIGEIAGTAHADRQV